MLEAQDVADENRLKLSDNTALISFETAEEVAERLNEAISKMGRAPVGRVVIRKPDWAAKGGKAAGLGVILFYFEPK